MDKFVILLASSLLIGCGQVEDFIKNETTPNDPRQFNSIHPGLQEFYTEWQEATGTSPWHVTSGVAELEPDKVAVCTTWGNKYHQITYNSLYFDSHSYDQRHQTMFHEFGHCVLGLQHRDGRYDGCPLSIMNTYIFTSFDISNCYIPRFNYYIDELLN